MAGAGVRASASVFAAAEILAAGLPPLMVRAERLASSISLGVHGRHKAGIGQSFWQFHRYRFGDSIGDIDWRQSAKSQHLFVREREGEAAQSVFLWRDGSASMRYGSGEDRKIDRASLIALALGVLLVRAGERIALYGHQAPPSASRLAYRRLAHTLCVETPADDVLPPPADLTHHAQFVWLSDFLAPLDDIEATIRTLIQRGVVGRLVHVIDPAEEDFPFAGRTEFMAADGGERCLFGRAESVGVAYRRRFRARCETLAAMARRLGWNYLAHRIDRPPKTTLIALYADLSGHRGGGPS
jgi:uncharacterized protein (DUF58 family)